MQERYTRAMRKILAILIFICLNLSSFAKEESLEQKTQISILDATVLGVVEGLTEYLPVSSTGHLILTNEALGLNDETEIAENISLKSAADTYAIIIQIGAIFAVVFLYWKTLKSILLGVFGKDREGLLLARNIFIAFLPAALIGLCLYQVIEYFLFGVYPVAISLFLGGLVMLFVKAKYEKTAMQKADTNLAKLSPKQCLIVGLLQCLALIPGASRSMMTILGGYVIGLNPKSAAKFSFLLGLITLSAASSFKVLTDSQSMLGAISLQNALWGIFVSFVFAIICVKFFVYFLSKWGLAPFAWYRIILSLVLLYVFR